MDVVLAAIIGWVAIGWACLAIIADDMKTAFGRPVWREPTTWVMFYPAAILGPLMLIILVLCRKHAD